MKPPPGQLIDRLLSCEPDVCDAEQLDALTAHVADVKAWCDALQVRITRAQRKLADEGRAPDPRNSIARNGRTSAKDAQAAAERETVCTSMPAFEDALGNGSISAGHVDALANAGRRLDDAAQAELHACVDELLADAERLGVDAFARAAKDRARAIAAQLRPDADVEELEQQRAAAKVTRWTDATTGMRHTHLELDPLADREFWTAVQRQRAALRRRADQPPSWDRLTVDAVVSAVQTTVDGDGSGPVPGISVLIDLDTLTNGRHDRSICEAEDGTPLPVSTVRRMACEADLIPVVLGGDGRVLDVGRSRRLATEAQRTAIAAMHRTCVHPDCDTPVEDCRIHHLVPWSKGGRTDLDDLAPACEPHHHDVHEGGWTLTMTPDRIATWIRPDGIVHWTGPTIDRRPTTSAVRTSRPLPRLTATARVDTTS